MSQHINLFITCLAEQFFPNVLEKMVKILQRLDIEPIFLPNQTCCGQPLFNSGFKNQAKLIATEFLKTFGVNDYPIVSPSGSCVDMVVHHYHELFPAGTPEHDLCKDITSRTYEFSQFLVNFIKITDLGASFPHKVTYHPSCHLLRGLGVNQEVYQLLNGVRNLQLIPLPEAETCCGFGGVFSVVYPDVSRKMMNNKIKNILSTDVEYVIANDAGCLMNISGGLSKAGSSVKAIHLIEVLASTGGDQ